MNRNRTGPAGWREGFTLIELMIVVAIIGVLLAIILPAVTKSLEITRQLKCRTQIKAIYDSAVTYSHAHEGRLPLALGAACTYGVAATSRNVAPADDADTPASAMIWQILRATGLPTKIAVCPSSGHRADPTDPQEEGVYDFQSAASCSYAIQYPCGGQTYLPRASFQSSELPMLADRGPFLGDGGDLGKMPDTSADAINAWLGSASNRAKVNSANHGGLGQNVIFADGHGEWCETPLVGLSRDNIYTRQAADTPVGRMKGTAPAAGGKQEPASPRDTLLVH